MKGNPNVTVYDNGGKTCDRFTALIGEDAFFMSDNASSPNGVCMYAGQADDVYPDEQRERVYFSRLPGGVQKAISRILKEQTT